MKKVVSRTKRKIDQWQPDPGFEPLTQEKAVGLKNLLSISWLSRGLELGEGVARLVWPGGFGTGVLIANDLLLTNNHVTEDKGTADETTAEFNYQKTWSGELEAVQRFELDSKRFMTNVDLDYTMVGVKGSPGDLFGYVDLADRVMPAVNDFVSIIQHPEGGPKQISFIDNKVSAVFGIRVQYASDTEPGSSGSPVFNQQWQLVGLHHAGGGLAGPNGKKHFTNEGILISAIVQDAAKFLGLSDSLYDLSFSDMRSLLVEMVKGSRPIGDPIAFAATALRQVPRLPIAFKDWLTLNAHAGDNPVPALAVAGIAIGAALRHWARTAGHESIPAVAASQPAPTPALTMEVQKCRTSSALPSDMYAAVVDTVGKAPVLVQPIVRAVGVGQGMIWEAAAFLVGVTVGAHAYGPESDRG
jgi:V8-like Glu-specific endopeptidase